MRNQILPPDAQEIRYEIRGIVRKGFELQQLGYPVWWENIGDPVQKGARIPEWVKLIISKYALSDKTYGYCDSKGLLETRRFLADKTNARGGAQISADDITFFNGLGDAIARIYSVPSRHVTILMPSPTYPAHSGAELARTRRPLTTYPLHPENNWEPDPAEVEEIVKSNPDITAILIINPDNPTGTVYSRETLEAMIDVARRNDLFVISDEIYENLVHTGKMVRLAKVIGDVPGIALKGISKEIPWPGSRCGWVEYYNRDKDEAFRKFCERVDLLKMTEVCSTTMPQRVIPEIMSDVRYQQYLDENHARFSRRSAAVKEALKEIPGITCTGGGGAFYSVISFDKELLETPFSFEGINSKREDLYRKWSAGVDPSDFTLTYYLLAAHGICAVPLSSFSCDIYGLRITLLEESDREFDAMLKTLSEALGRWALSSKKVRVEAF